MNNQINFALNWNGKLYCNCFTTIRPRNDQKYQLNHVYDINCKNVEQGQAEIKFMKHFKLSALTEAMALVDTGYPKKEALEIMASLYPDIPDITNQEFSYIVLKRTVQDINHNNQINEIRNLQTTTVSLSG